MDIKNVKNVKSINYYQMDYCINKIVDREGAIIIPSSEAYKKFRWTRDYFKEEPKEGYFIWVKKSINHPLTTCITISSPKIIQKPENLVVIEKNVEVKIQSICNTSKKNLRGKHVGYSKFILKKNSELKLGHFHSWGKRDWVESSLEFFLEEGAKLTHTYKCLEIPMKLKTENNTYLRENSLSNLIITILANDGEVDMHDSTFLNGRESNGISRVRMIGDKRSKIIVHSQMVANNAGTGHVDCMGLLLSENSSVQAIPELMNRNKNASLTHEASVGKISEEALNYLRSRGLTEDEAIDLIVTGFLGEEEPVIIKGRIVPSKFYM